MTLLDAYGRRVNLPALRREHASVSGVRSVFTDTVASSLTPQKLASLLGSANEGDHQGYLTLAEEIEERDAHYRSVLSTRRLAVAGLEPIVEAAGEDKRSEELAAAVRELVRDAAFTDLANDLLDALGKGYAVAEIDWHTQGQRWQPSYAWRDPRYFMWEATRTRAKRSAKKAHRRAWNCHRTSSSCTFRA